MTPLVEVSRLVPFSELPLKRGGSFKGIQRGRWAKRPEELPRKLFPKEGYSVLCQDHNI